MSPGSAPLAVLLAGAKSSSGPPDKGWKIVVNASVEPDL